MKRVWTLTAIYDHESKESIKILLDEVCNIYSEIEHMTWTLFHFAVGQQHYEVLDLLLERDYNINYIPSCGYSAISLAVKLDCDFAQQESKQIKYIHTLELLKRGGEVENVNEKGDSIVDIANSYSFDFARVLEETLKKMNLEPKQV